MRENPFEHRDLHDRQRLLRCRVSEGAQPSPLAPNQNDRFHPVVVVVPLAVVVVDLAAVVVVVPLAVVVVVPGLVVDVMGGTVGAVVVAVVAFWAFKTATTTVPSGRATLVPLGANAIVINSVDCVNRTVRRSPVWVVPVLAVAVGQTFATSSPVLPASGVPDGHF